ncbi:MAG: helix-hairpin-helix domain-containing protein [Clostridia bacterium]|nr:helix-hairpin-helix domain-containing protein [Clostridia bacterium]
MQNIKKYKMIYIILCISIVLICVIICFFMDNNNNTNDNYNFIEFTEENNKSEDTNNMLESSEENRIIYIHITGEVVNPGVFMLNEGDRIKDAIEKAGGLTNDADIEKINLAYQLSDGQKINIPNVNDKNNNKENYITESDGENIIIADEDYEKKKKININTATQAELESLTGIGPSTAAKIIEYRKLNGKFKKIEDLKNVSGIGESKYESIKNDIVC